MSSVLGYRWLLSFVIPLLSACADTDPGSAPRIEFTETAFDAGRVEQGARVEHTFAFRNGGDRGLRVTRVRPSCDSTATVSSDTVIAPRSTAEIATSFDTAGLFGKVTRTIAVFSNDPSAPSTLLTLKADVDFDAAANPRQLYVGQVRAGDEVRVQGRIILAEGVQVTRLETSGSIVAARLVESATGSPPGNERRFQVRIAADAPPGDFTNRVTIHTTSRTIPVVTVPVTGQVAG